ncbi:MAG: Rieske 2Fe-2S domain-containing protein, partial [Gammaproteobacteria bacterium]|nr:Rieske 2Fe-2S domain-containing protein [Gammaproteobacteria bacterium]
MSATHESAARPALEPALPSSWYRSERVWAAEKERIFCREWLCAGREEQLPREAGAFRLLDILGESIILIRNRERELRGFYNTCRHRGSRLCRDPAAAGAGAPHLAGGIRGGRIT